MNMMTQDRFEELAATFGGTIAWWPDDEQAGAEALLASSPAAQDVLKAEQALDATLNTWEAPVPSQNLMARILGDAAEVAAAQPAAMAAPVAPQPQKAGLFSRFFGEVGWRPAGAMTACLALGFMAGLSGAPSPMDSDTDDIASIEADNEVIAAFFGDETESDPFDLEIL